MIGPTPVDEAIRRCEELRDLVSASPVALAWTVNPLALLHAMSGDFELAEQLLEQANETLTSSAACARASPTSRRSSGCSRTSPRSPSGRCAPASRALASMTDRAMLATTTAMLAQAVYAQGRIGEADELCRACG